MTRMLKPSLLAALLALPSAARPQAALDRPLAGYDKLVSQLASANVVGEPIRAGDATVIPFVAIRFEVGSAGAAVATGGGMDGSVVPLGVLIVRGDDVRVETIPQAAHEPTLARLVVQAILDRKLVFMGNGLNIPGAPGTVSELGPLISAQMGGTTIVGNALNLGSLSPPRPAPLATAASLAELQKLFDARNYEGALAMVDGLLAKDPRNAELKAWKARILESVAARTAPTPR